MTRLLRVNGALLFLAFAIGSVAHADIWFDDYGDLAWQYEQVRLDNLGRFVQMKPDYHGYLVFYQGPKETRKKFSRRINRAVQHLAARSKIDRSQITVLERRDSERSRTILQPVKVGLRQPKFP